MFSSRQNAWPVSPGCVVAGSRAHSVTVKGDAGIFMRDVLCCGRVIGPTSFRQIRSIVLTYLAHVHACRRMWVRGLCGCERSLGSVIASHDSPTASPRVDAFGGLGA